jgi:hypothetical protein
MQQAAVFAPSSTGTYTNLRAFGSVEAPWNGGGRPRSVTPMMLEALREHLLEKPDRYLDEMAVFL